jgi:hypothetical protein
VAEQDGLDVVVVGVEVEHALGLHGAFAAHDGGEQFVLVLEVDVERALRDAAGLGDVRHAGRVEAARKEHGARALDDLAPLGAVVLGSRGRGVDQFGMAHRLERSSQSATLSSFYR